MKPKNEKSPEYAAVEIAGPGDVIVMDSMETILLAIGGYIKFLSLLQIGIVCFVYTSNPGLGH